LGAGDHFWRDKWLTQRPRRNAVVGTGGYRLGVGDHFWRDKWLTQWVRGSRFGVRGAQEVCDGCRGLQGNFGFWIANLCLVHQV
jgi:hypothetical protein